MAKKTPCEHEDCEFSQTIETLQKDMRRVMIGVCGDVEGDKPGILQRVAALELKFKIAIAVTTSSASLCLIGGLIKGYLNTK